MGVRRDQSLAHDDDRHPSPPHHHHHHHHHHPPSCLNTLTHPIPLLLHQLTTIPIFNPSTNPPPPSSNHIQHHHHTPSKISKSHHICSLYFDPTASPIHTHTHNQKDQNVSKPNVPTRVGTFTTNS